MSSVTSTSATTPVPSTRGVRLQAQVGLCGCIPFHMSLAVYGGVWLFVPSKILANDTSFCLFNLQHFNSDQSQKQSVNLVLLTSLYPGRKFVRSNMNHLTVFGIQGHHKTYKEYSPFLCSIGNWKKCIKLSL